MNDTASQEAPALAPAQIFLNGKVELRPGDCRDVIRAMPDNSVDSVCCDPPYALVSIVKRFGGENAAPAKGNDAYMRASAGFMSRTWDTGEVAFADTFWREVLRVLKPGGHVVAFSGTRTYHRMAVAIEDAGFEIRDQLAWAYGSGFPKSHNIGRAIDQGIKKGWNDVSKALDNLDVETILEAWTNHSKIVTSAETLFQRSQTGVGRSTPRGDSVLGLALLKVNLAKSNAHAIIAELNLSEAHLTSEVETRSAPSSAEDFITALSAPVKSVEQSCAGRNQTSSDTTSSSAPWPALEWQNESPESKLKAAEALKIWLGRKKSSEKEDTNALCAALTDDLKRIILSRSKTFRGLGTKSQMDFASATAVIITESTAASLISFTADILKLEAEAGAKDATRETVRVTNVRNPKATGGDKDGTEGATRPWIEAALERGYHEKDGDEAATPQAAEWQGWGTALKPAWEPICLARKPLIGTVAENVLEHGTGALNIDGCRVEAGEDHAANCARNNVSGIWREHGSVEGVRTEASPLGRWPANIVHDGSDEVVSCFPDAPGQQRAVGPQHGAKTSVNTYGDYGPRDDFQPRLDQGSAARFFYTAKADKLDRIGSKHPTVKPVDLMQWLVRLVTPKGGLVLDPFAGSGSTGEAAWREGMRCILIEREEEYQADIAERLRLADKGPATRKARAIKQVANDNLPLFGTVPTDTPPRRLKYGGRKSKFFVGDHR